MTSRKRTKYQPIWPVYKRLLGYTASFWPILVVAIVSMMLNAGALTAFVKLIKPLLDELFVNRDSSVIFWMPIWIIVIFLVRGISSFSQRYCIAYVSLQVVQQIRVEVFNTYLHLKSSFFSKESSGHQIARVTYTAEQVADASTTALKIAVTDGLTVVGMVGLMLFTSAYLTLSLFLLVPVIGLIFTVVSRRYRKISHHVQDKMGEVTNNVDEAVVGQREVKIYGAQKGASGRFRHVVNKTRQLNMKVQTTNALSSSMVQTVGAMSLALIVFMATRPGTIELMTPGDFTRLIMAMGAILPSIKRLATVQSNIQKGMAAAEELFEVLDMPQEKDTGRQTLTQARGDIHFQQISMQYPGASAKALDNITFQCQAGSMTALVGRSGSGKSTLVDLLPRFHEPVEGRILLDNYAISDYRLMDLRRQMAWVGQSVVLFADTIAGNIAYGELAGTSEGRIIEAAEAANAMEFIRELPDGIHTWIGQNGHLLSGGQRQRIAIARAILKNAPILILDEATSALDTQSERLIQEALTRLMRNRTTLVIAHRLSTIEHADQIIVLEHGKIAEKGTHTDLLAQKGVYAHLHKIQFKHETSDEKNAEVG